MKSVKLPVRLSNKHVHLSRTDVDRLFGIGYELKKIKGLSDSEYACKEKVDIVGAKGILKDVRIVGPVRANSQVEISLTDARLIGIDTVIRESRNLEQSPGVKLIGPKGEFILQNGVIAALRHIHINSIDAEKIGVKNGDFVSVKTVGKRSLVFNNVLIRVSKDGDMEMHIDFDEGNAAQLSNSDTVEIIFNY